MQNNQKPNKPGQQDTSPVLKRVRKSVYKQALLAGLLIVLTVVILFAVTAAWYTNIVQSSGLVFEASTWGFDGSVKLTTGAISAAPGDEGVVELTAESKSNELTAVSLNVSKAQMDPVMQKRIFFYVDTSKVRNGETMDRIYLSNQDSYTYLLFSQQTLMLTEQIHNDALLKWHWVYDVLGYYVQATYTNGTMSIDEYLRPIEYEYDPLKTTFEEGSGQLSTIDGTKTVATFLSELSKTDGYAGVIDTTQAVTTSDGRIYYPVSVDETGVGVWAYLCTYSEIMTNTEEDTKLGQAASQENAPTYTATLTIAAQNSNLEAVQASTAAALEDQIAKALTSDTKSLIQLGDNVTLTQPLVIGSSTTQQQVMLDLNGKTLTVDSGTYAEKTAGIQVAEGSSLTIINGDLVGTDKGFALAGSAAEITLSGVDISNVETALYIRDNAATGTGDSKIRLFDCTINCSEEGIYLSGNGSVSAQTTQLVVEDTTIDSGYIGIMGNGSDNQSGTNIQILNSTITGLWAGVYQPQKDGVLVISDRSSLSGYTGLVLKGGSTSIIDSSISGTGKEQVPTAASMSGFNDTGDAIYIESNYDGEITLDITGNSIVTSDYAQALRIYPNTNNVDVTIHSGCFSTAVNLYCATNTQHTGPDADGNYWVSAVATQTEVNETEDTNTTDDDAEEQSASALTEDESTQVEETLSGDTSA